MFVVRRNLIFVTNVCYERKTQRIQKISPVGRHNKVKIARYQIKLQVGSWICNLTNAGDFDQRVAVRVTSMSSTQGEYPIIAQAFWGARSMDLSGDYTEQVIYASISKGRFNCLLQRNICDPRVIVNMQKCVTSWVVSSESTVVIQHPFEPVLDAECYVKSLRLGTQIGVNGA